ncbi:flagellar basal body P-ring formation chaperone FlgA [Pseudochelatococcus sp. G4_1912]|uniref:flagellar basal body P-ring formation chaperone FlgA n=1 Tax=Pseudochelatococcus sp. G4_1912 TaxID=3114288 RepID=UPI0039C5F039
MLRVSAFCRILLCLGAVLAVSHPGQAQEKGTYATPTVTIYAGDVIENDMVDEREFAQLRPVRGGYATSAEALIGKVARRSLIPGLAIPQNAVENAKLVQKGVPTKLIFEDGGLSMVTLVSPLQAGELNEVIKARNVDSGLVVYGTVQSDGSLRAGESH